MNKSVDRCFFAAVRSEVDTEGSASLRAGEELYRFSFLGFVVVDGEESVGVGGGVLP